MQAQRKRKLYPGHFYNRYFDLADLKRTDPILMERSTVFDTLKAMEKLIGDTLDDTAKIAPVLKGRTRNETCERIFDFVYEHIQYTLDKQGVEQLRRPLRTWADRAAGVDCDCYSIFISSILTNLGIPHTLRMTKYKADWQHIYVVVPRSGNSLSNGYYTIDCVVDRYNHEVPYSEKHDIEMSQLQILNGFTQATYGQLKTGFGEEFNGFGTSSLQGLGNVNEAEDLYDDFLARLKAHLENTHKSLAANPTMHTLPFYVQLQRILAVWDNPLQRDAMLDKLEAEETAMAGIGHLGGFWDKIKKGVKNAAKAVGKGVKNASAWTGDKVKDAAQATAKAASKAYKSSTNWVGDKASDAWEGVKNAADWTIDNVVKYNPVSLLARNGLLMAFKLNLFRMAERLGYGYWTEQEAMAKGLNLAEFRKAKQTLNNVHSLWKTLRGDEESLKKNILIGWNKGIKKRGTVSGLGFTPAQNSYLGEVATTATATAAATPFIVKIVNWLKGINWPVLFQGVKNFLDRPQSTDYAASDTVPANYTIPDQEPQQQAPAPAPLPTKKDNTILYVGLVGAAAVAAIALSKK